MESGYDHRSLDDLETHPHKPGERWAVSSALEIDDYNLNVAVLEKDDPLSQTHYHAHENQEEFYYIIDGRCRVEVEGDSFDATEDDILLFREEERHLLHNPYDEPCKLVAIGSPPEGRYPVTMYDNFDNILADRYEDGLAEADE